MSSPSLVEVVLGIVAFYAGLAVLLATMVYLENSLTVHPEPDLASSLPAPEAISPQADPTTQPVLAPLASLAGHELAAG